MRNMLLRNTSLILMRFDKINLVIVSSVPFVLPAHTSSTLLFWAISSVLTAFLSAFYV